MDFLSTGLSAGAAVATAVAATALFLHAAWRAPWGLLADGFRLHGFLGTVIGIALAWLLAARPAGGLPLHLLATPLAALMFGRHLAAVAALPAAAIACQWRGGDWTGLAATWLLAGWWPAAALAYLHQQAERRLPANLFVFLFVNGFFVPGAVFALTVVLAASAHALAGTASADRIADGFVPYGLLLSWGEAFLTGLLTAVFTVYQPRWMASFDDARYLRPPPRHED